ncbi:MAG: hypothetical protein HYZ57_13565 [Acidobacteria bacterium]|nr:hypothetical protein [Acidobacteriota bacterium]
MGPVSEMCTGIVSVISGYRDIGNEERRYRNVSGLGVDRNEPVIPATAGP